MRTTIKIFLFTVAVSLFYTYVGHMVPQKEFHPPMTIELRADLTPAELAEIGRQIVAGKGTCLTCHTIGADKPGRFPDLGGIGARAAHRKPGYSDVDYLAESLYRPNAYIVPGFAPGMPQVNKPPIGLTDQEILAVIAYLQSLGGTPTVTLKTKLKWAGETATQETAPAPAGGTEGAGGGPQALFTKYLCTTCHKLDAPGKLVGPSLYDVGSRLSKGEIYEAIMDPDATVAPGFPPGIMSATLKANKFYQKVTPAELKAMVDYLASLKGDK
ncbi:MAG: cytochrome c [Calditrichaeota bacterium]|nr:MAG: cytochrome c [Calditrichota bacterium]